MRPREKQGLSFKIIHAAEILTRSVKMKKITLGFIAAVLSLFVISLPLGAAENKEAPKAPQIEMSHVVTATAKVEAVDKEKRTVTLKGPENAVTVKAEDWVDLDKVKPGDSVDAIYYESLTAEIYKKGEKPPLAGTQSIKFIDGSASTQAPSAAAAREITFTGTVQSLDARSNIVVLEDSDGNLRANKVKDPKNMDKIEEGDTIVVRVVQAIAVSVEKSPGKADK
jgi:Cu/Ag efflux protein CusF